MPKTGKTFQITYSITLQKQKEPHPSAQGNKTSGLSLCTVTHVSASPFSFSPRWTPSSMPWTSCQWCCQPHGLRSPALGLPSRAWTYRLVEPPQPSPSSARWHRLTAVHEYSGSRVYFTPSATLANFYKCLVRSFSDTPQLLIHSLVILNPWSQLTSLCCHPLRRKCPRCSG